MISVLIATRNRPQKIKNCLFSILKSSYKGFEIILVDQSTNNETEKIVERINSPRKIRYLKMNKKGKSKALNLGIKKARGEILALTDDDCVVDKKWLENISLDFQKDLKPVMVFGRVLPDSPRGNQGLHCISINKFGKKRFLPTLKSGTSDIIFFRK